MNRSTTRLHFSVMLEEAVASLKIKTNGTYIDATIGGGGHAKAILAQMTSGHLLGIDRDKMAIDMASSFISSTTGNKVTLYCDRFSNIDKLTSEPVDGVLADLGTSMMQLSNGKRGFSFMHTGPLDMRMGLSETKTQTALSLLTSYTQAQLAKAFAIYGGERHSLFIARLIKKHLASIHTTTDLAQMIAQYLPRRGVSIHPATRVFQALRILVNGEVEQLVKFLPRAYKMLKRGGIMTLLSFHSVEHRIVKRFMMAATTQRHNGLFDGREYEKGEWMERKAFPKREEVKINPGSRSATLRSIRKI